MNLTSKGDRVIILGCGLSGMISALAFAKYNIPTIILESKSTEHEDFLNDVRTTAITSASREILEKVDVWQALSDLVQPINDIYVAENMAPEMIHFSANYTPENKIMGYLIENSVLKKSLLALARENKLITILDGACYRQINSHSDYCRLIFDDRPALECDLLVVCEGRNSQAKNLFFSNKIEKDYQQKAITFVVEHEKKHAGTAVEHFMSAGTFAILPLQGEYFSSIVWSVPNDYASALLALPPEEFTYIAEKNFGPFLGKIRIKSKIVAFPLRAHAVKKYYNKRVVLIADSAHTIHPLAGQGLNQGIKDIDCLTELVAKKGVNIDVLAEYQESRKYDNENMLMITDSINSIFSSRSKIFHHAKQAGFSFIEKNPFFKRLLVRYAMGKRGQEQAAP